MTQYEERLHRDLDRIRGEVCDVGAAVAGATRDAVHAVLTADRALSARTTLGDMPINRKVREIDARCHRFVAQHLPTAGHLRFVSSVLRITVALERIGDHAVTIAREQVQLSKRPPEVVAHDLELLADQSHRMLHQALRAFEEGNAELARGTRAMGKQVESTFSRVFRDLQAAGESQSRPPQDLFALLVMFNRLSRIADQAKNLSEETLFIELGETKEPKVYRVLFLDSANACLSPMACAYADRAFEGKGRFSSAGWAPAQELDLRCRAFMERKGYDLHAVSPTALDSVRDSLSEQHVIVALEPGSPEQIGELPFHTTLVEWDLGEIDPSVDQQRVEAMLEDRFAKIRHEIGELMETLRGDVDGDA